MTYVPGAVIERALVDLKVKEEESQDKTVLVVIKIPTEIYSRVVGYFRPVQNWNLGKQQEFSERTLQTPESLQKFINKIL